MQTHFLKSINPFFQDLWEKKKTFEIRLNDRDYMVDDELVLREYDPVTDTRSGREIHVKVPYILSGEPYLPPKYVCMSIQEVRRYEWG